MSEMSFDELQQIVSVCLDEIVKLKGENEALKAETASLNSSLNALLNSVSSISKSYVTSEKSNNIRFDTYAAALDNMKYELFDKNLDRAKLVYPNICDIDKTIEYLAVNKRSMARFGDGEFAIMSGVQRQPFQTMDMRLSDMLRKVIEVDDENFLIAIQDAFGNLDKYNQHGKQEIRVYMTDETRQDILRYIHIDRLYHNTYITRPYATYADNNTDAPLHRFNALKTIWNNRHIIFVEGCQSRLGVGNDLFDNAASIKRIEAPATNSFSKYDEILSAALSHADKDVLFLIALGPTAGVLAYDLFKNGYQAIDIGHLDLEYEWFRNGTGGRSEIKTKYNNEFPGGDQVSDVDDPKYLSEIICEIY